MLAVVEESTRFLVQKAVLPPQFVGQYFFRYKEFISYSCPLWFHLPIEWGRSVEWKAQAQVVGHLGQYLGAQLDTE